MIDRYKYVSSIKKALKRSRITALLGPRQSGKTTLARIIAESTASHFFDLEYQPDIIRMQNPYLAMEDLSGLVIIDEIQVMPDLFKVLRVLSDRQKSQTRYLILGSASPDIIRNVSETLAGRVEFIELSGFNLDEIGSDNWKKLWLQGGFPGSFLVDCMEDSLAWRDGFIQTFLERDIPALGINIPSMTMRRFWTMLAHQHGQILNCSKLGRSIGTSDKTIRSYLDILTGSFMVRQLQPWFENISKRQVKSPKIYLRDSGLFHKLLTIRNMNELMSHPVVGASWEGFVIEQLFQILWNADMYFWATQSGAEIDLVIRYKGRKFGVEVKFTENPRSTRSVFCAIESLNLEHVWMIHPGNDEYRISEKITALPVSMIPEFRQIID
ncbi:ATP-binding protein [bacterium]|nr:ATP-binding protein [bacterium]